MKKITVLAALAVSVFMSGCLILDYDSDVDRAIDDYCSWESYCGFRGYNQCEELYRGYKRDAPRCDGEIMDMARAYQSLTCSAYADYANGLDPCRYYLNNGYTTHYDCTVAMNAVYRADSNLRACLKSYGVSFYGY